MFKGSEIIPISEQLALILTQLVRANGAVVSKETLAVSVWPHEAVTDANLTQHIYMLRRLLGEHARDHKYILSVARFGYRFAASVVVERPALSDSFTTDAVSLGEALSDGSFEAFRNYCQGSFFLEQRTAPSLKRAIEFFEASLAKNPSYAPALIGLARSHTFLATYWHVPSNQAFPLAKSAIHKALVIDPTSAVAHAVWSGILAFCDWDWSAAERESDLAVQLNPGSTFARSNAAWVYICVARYREALEQAQLALSIEPSSLALRLLLARMFLHCGENARAIEIMSNLLEADTMFYLARRYRAQAYLFDGEPEKAIDDLNLLPRERSEDASFRLPMLARAYADAGDRRQAEQTFTKLRSLSQTEYVVYWNLAIVAYGLGDVEQAIEYLRCACERREPTLPFLKSVQWFAGISDDPRFRALLSTIGP